MLYKKEWPKVAFHGPSKSCTPHDFAVQYPESPVLRRSVQVRGIHQARLGGLPCSWLTFPHFSGPQMTGGHGQEMIDSWNFMKLWVSWYHGTMASFHASGCPSFQPASRNDVKFYQKSPRNPQLWPSFSLAPWKPSTTGVTGILPGMIRNHLLVMIHGYTCWFPDGIPPKSVLHGKWALDQNLSYGDGIDS